MPEDITIADDTLPAAGSSPTPAEVASQSAPIPGMAAEDGAERTDDFALVRTVIRLLLLLFVRCRRPSRSASSGRPVRIVLQHAFGVGGTTRVVFDVARFLATSHDVEIISLLRLRDTPVFAVPRGVRLRTVDDRRHGAFVHSGLRGAVVRWLQSQPSVLTVGADGWSARENTLWTDVRLVRMGRRWHGGIVIGTRPAINVMVGRLFGRKTLKVGQEHHSLSAHSPELVGTVLSEYPRLDMLTVLTRNDLEHYRRALPDDGPRVVHMPNAVPELDGGTSALDESVIMAAGRLVKGKGFDLLIEAFALVADQHPEWQLRIWGAGSQYKHLQRLVLRLELYERVLLMGQPERVGEAMEKASIFASSSRAEGFGMSIVEAMSKGLPVVSFDCPHGPRDIITSEKDGLLVPAEDVQALAAALSRLMGDATLRRDLATEAMQSVQRYDQAIIGQRWEHMLAVGSSR